MNHTFNRVPRICREISQCQYQCASRASPVMNYQWLLDPSLFRGSFISDSIHQLVFRVLRCFCFSLPQDLPLWLKIARFILYLAKFTALSFLSPLVRWCDYFTVLAVLTLKRWKCYLFFILLCSKVLKQGFGEFKWLMFFIGNKLYKLHRNYRWLFSKQ